MRKVYNYSIARIDVAVKAARDVDVEEMLVDFRGFRAADGVEGDLCLEIASAPEAKSDRWESVCEDCNEFGRLRLSRRPGAYRLEVETDGICHALTCNSDFTQGVAYLNRYDRRGADALSAMLHVMWAQRLVAHGGMSVHASCVEDGQRAYLFLGKSGTGKSTHSGLWLEQFPGVSLLNDDNPALRIIDGELWAFGTPWSGKSPCYRNVGRRVGGIARLSQAEENAFQWVTGVDAFVALLPSCGAIHSDAEIGSRLFDNVILAAEAAPIAHLDCNRLPEAATLCHQSFNKR
ncbi:MAG: phosphoenolpyruvate carboxykinase [Bacteroidales bacterium]|nr:phosphoenolpyruvate carboxykinase [Bacteroidales bacterium]